jgi:hypothetical protein
MGDDSAGDASGGHFSIYKQPFQLETFFNLKTWIMTAIKYLFLFGWSLVLFSLVIIIIRSHTFIRRKKDGNFNLSESIYAIALLVAAALVLIPVLQALAIDFDIVQKFYPERMLITLIDSGSVISIAGLGSYVLLFVAGRGLSTLFFFRRKALIEFDANNFSYALLRAGLLLSLGILLSPLCSPLFQLLLPVITTPFYR